MQHIPYRQNSTDIHDEGNMTEDQAMLILTDNGYLCLNTQHGFTGRYGDGAGAAKIFDTGRGTLTPDLLVFDTLGKPFWCEVKSKMPTSYDTYGYRADTISHYERLAKRTKHDVLFIVRDKSISEDITDIDAYRIALLDDALMEGVKLNGMLYLPAENFSPLADWIANDVEDAQMCLDFEEAVRNGEAAPLFSHRPPHLMGCDRVKVEWTCDSGSACQCGSRREYHHPE